MVTMISIGSDPVHVSIEIGARGIYVFLIANDDVVAMSPALRHKDVTISNYKGEALISFKGTTYWVRANVRWIRVLRL